MLSRRLAQLNKFSMTYYNEMPTRISIYWNGDPP